MGRKPRKNVQQLKENSSELPLTSSVVKSEKEEGFFEVEAPTSTPISNTNTSKNDEESVDDSPAKRSTSLPLSEMEEEGIPLLGPSTTSSSKTAFLFPPQPNISSASFVGEEESFLASDSAAEDGIMGNGTVKVETTETSTPPPSQSPAEAEEDQDQDDWDREEKRKRKKARQKEKRRAKKLALERKAAMHRIDVESTRSNSSILDSNCFNRIMDAVTVPISPPPENEMCVGLHKCPLTTIEYFFREIPCFIADSYKRFSSKVRKSTDDSLPPDSKNKATLSSFRHTVIMSLTLGAILIMAIVWMSCNDYRSAMFKRYISWLAYWVFLGILSSIGLGAGLPTFVLYLGPFVAKVTMAAEECSSLDFPEPPYPKQIICPLLNGVGHYETPSLLSIMSKVRWESIAWGFGTALGELPPYFVARAARHAGSLSPTKNEGRTGFFVNVQNCLQKFIMKVGFWGILLFASIPNPLFDLAGITCGHFLVPFSTFFGATVIGKSVIKSQLQMFFMILAFSEKSFARVLRFVGGIPVVGQSLKSSFAEFVEYHRASIHDKTTSHSGGFLKTASEIFVLVIIFYFIISIVNGMARSHYRRITSPHSALNRSRRKLKRDGMKGKKKQSRT